MDIDRVFLIGLSDAGLGIKQTKLFSTENLYEANCIVWDLVSIPQELNQKFGFNMEGDNNFPQKHGMMQLVERRLRRIEQWVLNGGILCVLIRTPLSIGYNDHNGYRHDSLWNLPILEFGDATRVTGEKLKYCGPIEAEEPAITFVENRYYEAFLTGKTLLPLLSVSTDTSNTQQVVGGYLRLGEGLVVFLPPIKPRPDDQDYPEFAKRFLRNVVEIGPCLMAGGSGLPGWTEHFCLPREAEARQLIDEARNKIQNLEAEIIEGQEIVDSELGAKNLFCGYGDPFELAVKQALEGLGFTVAKGKGRHADMLAWDGHNLAAIEAKGLVGSASANNIRQVVNWRNDTLNALQGSNEEIKAHPELREYRATLVDLGVPLEGETVPTECKAIIVIGTYRDTPLPDRRNPDFPDQAARQAARDSVCALTGLQLLGLSLAVHQEPESADEIRARVISTSGPFASVLDWTEFLCVRDKNEQTHTE